MLSDYADTMRDGLNQLTGFHSTLTGTPKLNGTLAYTYDAYSRLRTMNRGTSFEWWFVVSAGVE